MCIRDRLSTYRNWLVKLSWWNQYFYSDLLQRRRWGLWKISIGHYCFWCCRISKLEINWSITTQRFINRSPKLLRWSRSASWLWPRWSGRCLSTRYCNSSMDNSRRVWCWSWCQSREYCSNQSSIHVLDKRDRSFWSKQFCLSNSIIRWFCIWSIFFI